jgi:DNA polymerase III subunit epsilon
VQLALDALDRLVETLEETGPLSTVEAARSLFATSSISEGLAASLLVDVTAGDSRVVCRGATVSLTGETRDSLLDEAAFVVFDLETTGLSARDRICEIGAVRVERLELAATFQTFADPRTPLPAAIAALTGIAERDLRGAPSAATATRRFVEFARDAVVVAHNARFDLGFLDREVELLTGRRIAAPVVDTVWLARRLLGERTRRVGLATLAHFFGVSTEPCHRALPDARATAEILLALVGLAQERGARSLADLVELAAPRARRLHTKRSLVSGAPASPGVYLFRGAGGMTLYVGRARQLRTRLRSYFAGERQRPAVEAALAALERVDWRETGSEFEAGLEELRLLRELRPPANARGTRPDRHVYLRRRGPRWGVTTEPTAFGPLTGKGAARKAARALDGHESDDIETAIPPLRARLRRLAREQRFEDAARLRDRLEALEATVEALRELGRLRRLRTCVVVPAGRPGFVRVYAIARGRVAAVRLVPRGAGGLAEIQALLAEAERAPKASGPEDADELRLVATFLRRPPPELRAAPLETDAIRAAVEGIPLAA